MRIDHRNRTRHRHHRLDGIAACREDALPGFGGQPMRCRHGGMGENRGVFHERASFGGSEERVSRSGGCQSRRDPVAEKATFIS